MKNHRTTIAYPLRSALLWKAPALRCSPYKHAAVHGASSADVPESLLSVHRIPRATPWLRACTSAVNALFENLDRRWPWEKDTLAISVPIRPGRAPWYGLTATQYWTIPASGCKRWALLPILRRGKSEPTLPVERWKANSTNTCTAGPGRRRGEPGTLEFYVLVLLTVSGS